MTVVKAILTHFISFLMSAVITIVPISGTEKESVIATLYDNSQLTVELISDTHLEADELVRQGFLKTGFTNMKNAECDIDAIVITGDITNYADEESLASFYEIVDDFSPAPVIPVSGNHDIGHAGDRDVTTISREEARDNFIRYRNAYTGRDDGIYYSTEVNGYKFIILGDEVIDGGHWDAISMSDEQLAFLDSELAAGTAEGKPVFVCCHWPLQDVNGEDVIWPESGIQKSEYGVQAILEKYNNVFWISGHMHSGLKSTDAEESYDLSNAEVINGVTYINLPTYGLVNMFGIPWSGTGAQLEVYENEVVFRPICYLTDNWYENCEYHFDIV